MGTEDEQQLTVAGRAQAAAGAAFVAAAIVNPLDVIKTRIQAQAMAAASGQATCTASSFKCTSTLYEHAARRTLHHCPTEQQQQLQRQRYSQLLRHSHTLSPAEAAAWLQHSSSSSCAAPPAASARAAAAAALAAAADRAAAATAGAAAAFRRWGITEGPIPVRRTPAPPPGYPPLAAVRPAAAAGAGMRSGGAAAATAALNACECAAASAAQQQQLPSHSMWETAKSISAREGLPVLWRGTSASLLIAVPMVGIYMPMYDALLQQWGEGLGRAAPIAAGTAARTVACFCVAPFELLRTRLQASAGSGVSMRSTITHFLLQDHHTQQQQQRPAQAQLQVQQQRQQQLGPRAVLRAVPRMWTGFSATLVRDVPFSALYWALVEPFRQAMLPRNSHWNTRPTKQQQQAPALAASSSSSSGSGSGYRQQHLQHTQLEILVANMVSGFVAGGVAAGLTTPFDVVKTRMQIAAPSSSSSSSAGGVRVWRILQDVYRKDGVEGLFTGLKPRAYRAAPACAIVISVYELLKHWLAPQ